jgi:hypothetical protein
LGNTIGIQNTATGFNALYNNTTGGHNTANGYNALLNNTTGTSNTAIGQGTLNLLTIGNSNTAIGQTALNHLTTGSNNIGLGFNAGTTVTIGSNNIEIGNAGVAADANTIRIGKIGTQTNTFIAGISGSTVPNGVGVIINSKGQLGTVQSSARFKDQIKPMDNASEAIMALRPVTFHYKDDKENTPQFGLIAEEVAKANPDLVVRDDKGEIYTVRYDAVNAMLLNEFLKGYRKVEEQARKLAEQDQRITQQQGRIESQNAIAIHQQQQIEALTEGLQKVSAQIELNKNAPQQVAENQ